MEFPILNGKEFIMENMRHINFVWNVPEIKLESDIQLGSAQFWDHYAMHFIWGCWGNDGDVPSGSDRHDMTSCT